MHSSAEILPHQDAPPGAPERLSGHMTTTALVLSVLAFSSPLTTVAGYLAFVIGSGGESAPVAFLACTLVLGIFAVGYMAMTKRMPKPGAFYAYISSGLGRQVGLGGAFVALVGYTLILIGVYFFVGLVVAGLVDEYVGASVDWWVGALLIWALVGVLGYFNVDVSARVLVWVMILEVILVGIFNVAVLVQGGKDGIRGEPLNVSSYLSSGGVAISMMFCILTFIGFEATALYRDEVRDPERTLPRATYIAVAFIGLFYAFTTYALVTAFGKGAQDAANKDAAGMFSSSAEKFLGHTYSQIVSVLLLTALLACLLSIHNASTRYLFNLSADGALPKPLAAVHARFKSPFRSSIGITVATGACLLFYAVKGNDPGLLYGQMAGLGSTAIISLMALVSVAVIVWFAKQGAAAREPMWVWKTVVAPLIAAVALGAIFVYVVRHFEYVVGGKPGENLYTLIFPSAAFLAGVAIATVLKYRRPEKYALLGGNSR